MKLLVHTCCAICAIGSFEELAGEDLELTGFFYNPNIHPYQEFFARLKACRQYFTEKSIPFLENSAYRLEEYLTATLDKGEERCRTCYRLRLEETARTAAELDFPAFTTTLLISPYQNQEWLKEEGERAAGLYRREFIFRDLRPFFARAQSISRELGIYRQKYCGCIFSEKARFCKA